MPAPNKPPSPTPLLTDEEAERIVVTANLYGCSESVAAQRLGLLVEGKTFVTGGYPNETWTWDAMIKVIRARKRLQKLVDRKT